MSVKEEVQRVLDGLEDDGGWEDVMYELYVRWSLVEGLKDVEEGRVMSHEEVKKRLLVRGGVHE